MNLRKIGFAVAAAAVMTTTLFGSATASAGPEAVTDRFANYAAQQCITSNTDGGLRAGACTPITRLKQWTWSGVINGTTTITNLGTGYCLDSNEAGHVYSLRCNGTDYQKWVVIQPAPGSAILLQNLETRRCLQQNSSGLYSTQEQDRNSRVQRWTIG